jgi:hypothetical protein
MGMADAWTGKLNTSGFISPRQLKAIWALARRAGLQEEGLHRVVESLTGKRSLRSLSKEEARGIIEDLLLKTGMKVISYPGGGGLGQITRAQMALIGGLTMQMGWDRQRLVGLARKMYGVGWLIDLKAKQASGLIEALKVMRKRRALERINPVKGQVA